MSYYRRVVSVVDHWRNYIRNQSGFYHNQNVVDVFSGLSALGLSLYRKPVYIFLSKLNRCCAQSARATESVDSRPFSRESHTPRNTLRACRLSPVSLPILILHQMAFV